MKCLLLHIKSFALRRSHSPAQDVDRNGCHHGSFSSPSMVEDGSRDQHLNINITRPQGSYITSAPSETATTTAISESTTPAASPSFNARLNHTYGTYLSSPPRSAAAQPRSWRFERPVRAQSGSPFRPPNQEQWSPSPSPRRTPSNRIASSFGGCPAKQPSSRHRACVTAVRCWGRLWDGRRFGIARKL